MKARIAVVGAATLIGEALIAELHARKLGGGELHRVDDARHLGHKDENVESPILDVAGFDFSTVDLVFFCGRAALSETYAEKAAAHAWVIDGSGVFRQRMDVPLVAADVNPDALRAVKSRGLIALPGSASVALSTALAPLHALCGLKRVEVATYQAVSGSGRGAMEELAAETVAMLSSRKARGSAYGRQIAFNVIPRVDEVDGEGVSREERRIWEETRRVLGLDRLAINVTAVRVPVFFGHGMAVHALFERAASLAAVAEVLRRGAGLNLMEIGEGAEFPTPAELALAPDQVYIGRLRRDPTRDGSLDFGLNFWVMADNVRKCAAHNAVSVAQILVNRSH